MPRPESIYSWTVKFFIPRDFKDMNQNSESFKRYGIANVGVEKIKTMIEGFDDIGVMRKWVMIKFYVA